VSWDRKRPDRNNGNYGKRRSVAIQAIRGLLQLIIPESLVDSVIREDSKRSAHVGIKEDSKLAQSQTLLAEFTTEIKPYTVVTLAQVQSRASNCGTAGLHSRSQ